MWDFEDETSPNKLDYDYTEFGAVNERLVRFSKKSSREVLTMLDDDEQNIFLVKISWEEAEAG